MAEKLTIALCKAARYEGNKKNPQDIRWDSEVAGLGLRVYPSERKSFVFRYRHHGRQRIMVLGPFGVKDPGALTLDQARKVAGLLAHKVRDGADPAQEKKSKRQAPTFGDLVTEYGARHAPRKKTGDVDRRRLDRLIPEAWRGRKLASITSDDVIRLHAKIGKDRPYLANRLTSLLNKMFNLARKWGMAPQNTANPCEFVERFPEEGRDRWATSQEMGAVLKAAEAEGVYVAASIWFLFLTGARKSEALSARWSHIDLTQGIWHLPNTKSGKAQIVSLSSAAIKLLERLPRTEGSPFLFPGRRPGQHLVDLGGPWDRIRLAAGCPDLRIHDIRRSTGSWMAQSGVSLATIKDALRHQNISTTQIYARLGEKPAAEALEAHGEAVLKIAGGDSA